MKKHSLPLAQIGLFSWPEKEDAEPNFDKHLEVKAKAAVKSSVL